jgi:prolyl oligopeptidase
MQRIIRILSALALVCLVVVRVPVRAQSDDPFGWLEEKDNARVNAWVTEQNAKTVSVLSADRHFARFVKEALTIEQSKDRIPSPGIHSGAIYNLWQDTTHVQGIWRKTSMQSYATANPAWTTVLDLDALSKKDHKQWVWEGLTCEPVAERRCIVQLSNGGEDAQTLREFDLGTDRFVPGGFSFPRQKQWASWLDPNTLLVTRAWKPGELTASSYPYVIKRLRRGEPLSSAVEVFRGKPTDVAVQSTRFVDGDGNSVTIIDRSPTFFTSIHFLLTPRGLRQIDLPLKSDVDGLVGGRLLVTLKQPFAKHGVTYPQGSLIALDLRAIEARPSDAHPTLVYAPGPRDTLDSVSTTKSAALLMTYHNVRGRALVYTPTANGWKRAALPLPDNSSIDVATSTSKSDDFYATVTGFLNPTQLYAGNARTTNVSLVKALPSQWNSSNDVVEQHWATSKDGTKIPYFILHPKKMKLDGDNPTLLNAYGGFQISMTPYYSGLGGKLWNEPGGVSVLANIRGGGEFGPAWHEAAMGTNRQRAYDDFYAVAQDLVNRKITSPRRLGIIGGSNGGLLMGVEFVQHPTTWNAVDIEVPLLDMLRYEKLEAGASWVGEYGSVSNPIYRAFWEKTSPYENLNPDVTYPEPLVMTNRKDDRVGPEQGRKFAAKLESMNKPCLYYEVIAGGHARGANLQESARTDALELTYITMKLKE